MERIMLNEEYKKAAIELLDRAEQILDDGKAWIKGADAMTSAGALVNPYSEKACKFCLNGAILKANHEMFGKFVCDWAGTILKWSVKPIPPRGLGLMEFNDDIKTVYSDIKTYIDQWKSNINERGLQDGY